MPRKITMVAAFAASLLMSPTAFAAHVHAHNKWLGQTYAKYQSRKQSIEALVHLIYERRTHAGMVASALRRGADIEEITLSKARV